MDDELDVLAGLSPEQTIERAKALMLEGEYWQQVLADASTVNGAVLDGTNAALDATTAALALLPLGGPAQAPIVELIVGRLGDVVRAFKAVVDALDGTVELADGRQKALRPVVDVLMRAAGSEPDDDDEPAA